MGSPADSRADGEAPADHPPPTASDRLFRVFLELQEREGHAAALARFRREHPEEAAKMASVLAAAATLETATEIDEGGGVLDERLLTPLKGRYRVERFLARGGMGDVYLATDTRVDALVAVKLFSRAGDAELRARFLREARVGGRLSHRQRGTVRVHDLDTLDDGTPFLVMEYVEGRSLAAVLRDGRLPPGVVADLVARLAETLGAIHQDGVVHCDLKPSNVILQPRTGGGFEPVLIDFGVARVRGPLQVGPDTRSGEFRGTVCYASPESLDGEAGPASDQFSLAVLAWEALAGRRPFDADGLAGLVDQIRAREVERIDRENPAVPLAMARAIEVAMAKRPSDRFPSISDFGRAVSGAGPLPRQLPRRWAGVAVAASLGAVVSSIGWIGWWQAARPTPVMTPAPAPSTMASAPAPSTIAPAPAPTTIAPAPAPAPSGPLSAPALEARAGSDPVRVPASAPAPSLRRRPSRPVAAAPAPSAPDPPSPPAPAPVVARPPEPVPVAPARPADVTPRPAPAHPTSPGPPQGPKAGDVPF